MIDSGESLPVAVVALGGNALLPRGESPEAALQFRAAREAARSLAGALGSHRLVITHGNGPQVGLLALMNDAYTGVDPYPLDVLDAESEGQIGYVIEMEIDNATDACDTVALITRVVVDEADPAFNEPTKFIGPVYDEETAKDLAAKRGWRSNRTAKGGAVSCPLPNLRQSSNCRRSASWSTPASSWSVRAAAASRWSRKTVATAAWRR